MSNSDLQEPPAKVKTVLIISRERFLICLRWAGLCYKSVMSQAPISMWQHLNQSVMTVDGLMSIFSHDNKKNNFRGFTLKQMCLRRQLIWILQQFHSLKKGRILRLLLRWNVLLLFHLERSLLKVEQSKTLSASVSVRVYDESLVKLPCSPSSVSYSCFAAENSVIIV